MLRDDRGSGYRSYLVFSNMSETVIVELGYKVASVYNFRSRYQMRQSNAYRVDDSELQAV